MENMDMETKYDEFSLPSRPADPFLCEMCNLHCGSKISLERHQKTPLHKQREQDEKEGKVELYEDGSIKRPIELYYCDICDVTATCARNLEVHKEGARHHKNLANRNRGGYESTEPISYQKRKQTKVTLPPGGRLARIQSAAEGLPEPVIGLSYVVEFQRPGEPPRYVCNLCECKADSSTILTHIVGLKHRTNYMKEHHSDQFSEMRQKAIKKSDQSVILEEFARTIEAEHKRGKVKVKLELNPFAEEDEQRGLKRPMGVDMGPAPKRFDYVPGGRGGRGGGRGGRGGFGGHSGGYEEYNYGPFGSMAPPPPADTPTNLRNILSSLTTCKISNEEEAALALQVSNALTQALLNYRLAPTAKKEIPARGVNRDRGAGRGRGGFGRKPAAPTPAFEPYVEDDAPWMGNGGYGMGNDGFGMGSDGFGMSVDSMDSYRSNFSSSGAGNYSSSGAGQFSSAGSISKGGNNSYGGYDRNTSMY